LASFASVLNQFANNVPVNGWLSSRLFVRKTLKR